MKHAGQHITLDQQLAAAMLDALRFIQWTKTDHGRRRTYPEKSVLDALMNPKPKDEYMAFETPEEYEAYMKRFEA